MLKRDTRSKNPRELFPSVPEESNMEQDQANREMTRLATSKKFV